MGVLRAIFAISVVFAHSGWPAGMIFVGGENAVRLFYIISGFLISYVLLESKAYANLSSFYLNRYLRLYPIYFFVSIITLVIFVFLKNYSVFNVYKLAPASAGVFLAFSSVFLFAQDLVMFLGVKNNTLVFVTNFYNSDIVLYGGLLVPQAWTIGIEIMFYLIAPFVLPNRKFIFLVLLFSLSLRVYLVDIGIGDKDPWTYRFFPTELAFFLIGSLSHQILLPLYKKIFNGIVQLLASIATYFLIVISVVYFIVPIEEIWKQVFLFSAFTLLVPFCFIFQNIYKFDNWIGGLSYPIYICHIIVIFTSTYMLNKYNVEDKRVISCFSVFLSIICAVVLNKYIGYPLEKIRSKIRKHRQYSVM